MLGNGILVPINQRIGGLDNHVRVEADPNEASTQTLLTLAPRLVQLQCSQLSLP